MAQVSLDFRQGDRIFLAGEADRVTICAGSGSASDPMYVVSGVLRQVEVEHVTHIGDVQAAGCNISCNQYRQVPIVEVT